MGIKLGILQKERWQPTQRHAGHGCTHGCTLAMHLLLGVVATAQQFTFSLQLFSARSEVAEIPLPSTIDL